MAEAPAGRLQRQLDRGMIGAMDRRDSRRRALGGGQLAPQIAPADPMRQQAEPRTRPRALRRSAAGRVAQCGIEILLAAIEVDPGARHACDDRYGAFVDCLGDEQIGIAILQLFKDCMRDRARREQGGRIDASPMRYGANQRRFHGARPQALEPGHGAGQGGNHARSYTEIAALRSRLEYIYIRFWRDRFGLVRTLLINFSNILTQQMSPLVVRS